MPHPPSVNGATITATRQPRWVVGLFAFALFLIVVGARLWLIGAHGSDLPFWDQWDAEGANLYLPYFQGSLTLRDLFAAHNEHRVLFSRLLALGLLLVNGQWDARLQMVTNALLYSTVPCGLFVLFAKDRGRRSAIAWMLVLSVVFALPFGWENTLAGFQSQFYVLVALSLGATGLLATRLAGSGPWWAGVCLAVASLFAMASGFLAAAAVLCIAVLAVARKRDVAEGLREWWPTVMVGVGVVVLGSILAVTVPGHAASRAHGPAEFLSALLEVAAWPVHARPWALLNWLPFALFVLAYLSRRVPDLSRERFLLALGAWVLLQAAAIAFSRAAGPWAPRYMDLLAFGLLVNVGCAASLIAGSGKWKRAHLAVSAVWFVGNFTGLLTVSGLAAPTARKATYDVETANTSGYVTTGDVRFLTLPSKRNPFDIPYPDPKRLQGLLDAPELRAVLPAGIRPPAIVSRDPDGPAPMRLPKRPDLQRPYPWERVWVLSAAGGGSASPRPLTMDSPRSPTSSSG